MLIALVTLQAIQVVFLWGHDWVPLAPLNDVAAVRGADPMPRLIRVTLIQSVPYTIGLVFSALDLRTGWPGWLWTWLWVSYGLLFAGELRAWWVPYLFGSEPSRVARYRSLFGATHAFLAERHGITPNSLHVGLHICTAATLVMLAVLTF